MQSLHSVRRAAAVAAAAVLCLVPSVSYAEEAASSVSEPAAVETDASEASVSDGSDQYGVDAYTFLQAFTDAFPSRLNQENNRSLNDINAGVWIQAELQSFGYDVTAQDYVHFNYTGTNYSVTKPGNSDLVICIGAHYDCVDTTGTDDNGSGVSVLLELAKRFANVETPCTLNFVFFDNEEEGGYVGSCNYINQYLIPNGLLDKIICYINIDSVGAGDRLYAYGGEYDENHNLTNIWPYQLANICAEELDIPLYTMPEQVEMFDSPTRISGSDHYYFRENGIPYLYFEADLWCNENGNGGNPDTVLTCHYQTSNLSFVSTGGQIMHTAFDDLSVLNELLPGRVQTNLSNTSKLISTLLMAIDGDTASEMSLLPLLPETETSEDTTAAEIETAKGETSEAEASSAEDAETAVSSSENAEAENEAESHVPETTALTEAQTAAGPTYLAPPTTDSNTLPSDHRMITAIFGVVGAIVILLVAVVISTSTVNSRRRKRRHKN